MLSESKKVYLVLTNHTEGRNLTMSTPSQILRAKIIKKMEYKEILEEEITEMLKAHKVMLDKEVDKKYKIVKEKKRC